MGILHGTHAASSIGRQPEEDHNVAKSRADSLLHANLLPGARLVTRNGLEPGDGERRRRADHARGWNNRWPINSPSRTPAEHAKRPPPVCVVNWFSASSLDMLS